MNGAQERVSWDFEAHRAEPANAESQARGRESSLALLNLLEFREDTKKAEPVGSAF